MGIFNCLASSAVSTDTYQPLARTDSGAQVRQTELHNLRLGKHTNPAIVGGEVLARQGECLVLSASRDSVGHLLPDKGCAADEVVSLPQSASMAASFERSVTALFMSSSSASPRYQNQGVSEPSKQLEASARNVEIGKGLNAYYLSSYGRSATDESLQGLTVDKELGTARVQAFNRQRVSAMELKVTYQAMPFHEVSHVFDNVGRFPARVDELVAFVEGMTNFAYRFAHDHVEGYGKDCLRVTPDSEVDSFVANLLTKLSGDQKTLLSARLGMGLGEQAQQIFSFACEQAELLQDGELGHKLSQLGFGVRVMKTLMEQLGLEAMTDVESVNVGDMDIYELAALDRVLKRA